MCACVHACPVPLRFVVLPVHVADVNLWEEQLPANTLVVLSGRDALMAAPQVSISAQRACQGCGRTSNMCATAAPAWSRNS